jgi:hypothetical protein
MHLLLNLFSRKSRRSLLRIVRWTLDLPYEESILEGEMTEDVDPADSVMDIADEKDRPARFVLEYERRPAALKDC